MTLATCRMGVLQALFVIQLCEVLVVEGVLAVVQQTLPRSLGAWGLMGGISVINFVGTLLLYRAFAIGTLSLVSPIESGFAVVTAVLALSTGEHPPVLTLVGALLLILGVIAVSRAISGFTSLAGIPEAVGVTLCFGVYFWALNHITPTLGVLWPVWVTRLVQLVCALIAPGVRGPFKPGLTRRTAPLLLGAAILDSGALLSFNLGIGQTYTTITTALASLYSAVTVLLAWMFLREQLTCGQWAGVGVILVGVLLVRI